MEKPPPTGARRELASRLSRRVAATWLTPNAISLLSLGFSAGQAAPDVCAYGGLSGGSPAGPLIVLGSILTCGRRLQETARLLSAIGASLES